LAGAIKPIIRFLTRYDDILAGVIIIALVIGITYSLSSLSIARADPYNVSLSYFKKSDNGTMTRYYDTNATMDRMYIHNNPGARNRTYQEVVDFILSDDTDQRIYDEASFVCIDYAVAVHDHAERQNVSAGVITCEIGSTLHALNFFNTTDRGLIYVDCTGARAGEPVHNYDKIARIDDVYQVTPVIDISPYVYVNDKNDTVTNVHLYW
jgi:hypothetical protein